MNQWESPVSTKILNAIVAFRDIAQNRKCLQEEQAALEERQTFITNELGRTDYQYTDARKALIEAILAE